MGILVGEVKSEASIVFWCLASSQDRHSHSLIYQTFFDAFIMCQTLYWHLGYKDGQQFLSFKGFRISSLVLKWLWLFCLGGSEKYSFKNLLRNLQGSMHPQHTAWITFRFVYFFPSLILKSESKTEKGGMKEWGKENSPERMRKVNRKTNMLNFKRQKPKSKHRVKNWGEKQDSHSLYGLPFIVQSVY